MMPMLGSLSYVFGQIRLADVENQKLTATILHLDSLFWNTYNECNTENSGQFLPRT